MFVSLCSNQGHRLDTLNQAIDHIRRLSLFKDIRVSVALENEALLPPQAPASWDRPYLNVMLAGVPQKSPEELLSIFQDIERLLGRPAHYARWSPRTIDIDIVQWGDHVVQTPTLTIPHPELPNRSFWQHLMATLDPALESASYPRAIRSLSLSPRLVGIVNVTRDSFSDGGESLQPYQAASKAMRLFDEGASIVDIGAQSTRPDASLHDEESEYACLEPVLETLKPHMETIPVSLDSFLPQVIERVIENFPIRWVNSQKDDLPESTLRKIAEKGCQICVMHALSIPARRDLKYAPGTDPLPLLKVWGERTRDRMITCGFDASSVILDPGIGFGKTPYQHLSILQRVGELRASWGVPIMIGHSRKSTFGIFTNRPAAERDLETLGWSAALAGRVDYLRVHNVAMHARFLATYATLQNHGCECPIHLQ